MPDFYSTTHCCKTCERGEACEGTPQESGWCRCVGIPKTWIRSVRLPGAQSPVHFICHVPPRALEEDGKDALFPAVLFLHGAGTYLYPETLWVEVRDIVEKNSVAREKFIVAAAVGSLGEPIVAPSTRRTKRDRCGNDVAYVEKFHSELIWEAFVELCAHPFAPGVRADPRRLAAMGYSMGGQAVWDLACFHGQSLAAAVPFACACYWDDGVWDRIGEVERNLKHLALRQHSGEKDWYAYAPRDFEWIARVRGYDATPEEKALALTNGVSAQSTYWRKSADTDDAEGNDRVDMSDDSNGGSAPLELHLMSGTSTVHCCWEEVLHDEPGFGLFTWLLEQKLRTSTDSEETAMV